jgi:Coenzyme PQQ synthesis protein D (PqqD).
MSKKKRIAPNYMDTVFVPSPQRPWCKGEDGSVVIDVENKGPHHRIAQKFWHKPKVSHISLDAYGTALWNLMDGKNTVYDIVMAMKKQFPGEEDRMLDRVVTFLGTLQNNRFIIIKK